MPYARYEGVKVERAYERRATVGRRGDAGVGVIVMRGATKERG